MPIATSLGDTTERHELRSLPGGYVVLKRLGFGEKMLRKNLLGKAKIQTGGDGGGSRADRRRRSNSGEGFAAELEIINEAVTLLEFKTCIVDHNLTYLRIPGDLSSETPLNFSIPEHVKMLDGKVGDEIDELITDMNSFEDEEDTGK